MGRAENPAEQEDARVNLFIETEIIYFSIS